MIIGINTHVEHEGLDYHVQIEDLDASFELEVRVYLAGRIVFHKRQSYAAALESAGLTAPAEPVVREELQKLFTLVSAAIQKGRIRA